MSSDLKTIIWFFSGQWQSHQKSCRQPSDIIVRINFWHRLTFRNKAYCNLRNEMKRNEMKICNLQNGNMQMTCIFPFRKLQTLI